MLPSNVFMQTDHGGDAQLTESSTEEQLITSGRVVQKTVSEVDDRG